MLIATSGAVICFMLMATQGTPQTTDPTTREVIDRFNEAFNRHDADAIAAVFTDDTVFEDTSPAPVITLSPRSRGSLPIDRRVPA
jgi:hypothetical protein